MKSMLSAQCNGYKVGVSRNAVDPHNVLCLKDP